MSRKLAILFLFALNGCVIQNHALRGAANGIIGGPISVVEINNLDGVVPEESAILTAGIFMHMLAAVGLCFTGPIGCVGYFAGSAAFGAISTPFHYSKSEKPHIVRILGK